MKSTGIVRRIDDLGRVVIPKEIRRTTRIRENDPMEIFVGNDGEIILKKYSTMANLEQFARDYARALHSVSGYGVLVCDRHKVIEVAGAARKGLVGQPVSKALIDGESFASSSHVTQDIKQFGPVEGLELQAIIAAPILVDGDADGYIVLLAKDENSAAGESESKLVLTAAAFIGSRLSGF